MYAPTIRDIMIVEDDTDVSQRMAQTLERCGYKIICVLTTGEAAVQRAFEQHADLVVMDIVLDGYMDGIEAGRLIEQHYDIPVLYITGYYHRAEALQKKGKSPLLKPFGPDDLKNAVAHFKS